MNRLLAIIAVMTCALTTQSQTSISDLTYDQLYMKMKGDSVLQSIYFRLSEDISKTISLDTKIVEASAAVTAEWNLNIQKLADSLGVNPKDGAGDVRSHKFYNPNVDTVAFIKFLELRAPIDQKYSPLSMAASESVRAKYSEMLQDAFTAAANRYYENLERAKNQ